MPHANTHVCMCNTLRLAMHATYVRLPYIIANNNVLIRYSTPLAVHGADASFSRSSLSSASPSYCGSCQGVSCSCLPRSIGAASDDPSFSSATPYGSLSFMSACPVSCFADADQRPPRCRGSSRVARRRTPLFHPHLRQAAAARLLSHRRRLLSHASLS